MKKQYIFLISLLLLFLLGLVTATLWGSEGVRLYYDLNSTTELVDGIYNLTVFQGTGNFSNFGCLIGNCSSINSSNNFYLNGSQVTDLCNGNHTFNFWVNATDGTDVVLTDQISGIQVFMFANGTSLGINNFGVPSIGGVNIVNNWQMITLTTNTTNSSIYINGSLKGVGDIASCTSDTSSIYLGTKASGNDPDAYNGLMDELGFWNDTLTNSEIEELYNSGLGTPFSASSVTLNSPDDLNSTVNQTVIFNCTADNGGTALSNISLYHNVSGTYQLNETVNVTGTVNTTTFQVNMPDGTYLWSCSLGSSTGEEKYADENRTLTISTFVEDANLYNTTAHETESQTFKQNISVRNGLTLTNPKLIYNGEETTATSSKTGNSYELSVTRDIPLGAGDNGFYFNFTVGGEQSTTNTTQTVSAIQFSLCNTTQTTKFLNITFKDEGNSSRVNTTIPLSTWEYYLGSGTYSKNYSFTNNTNNMEYDFCANVNKTFYVDPYLQYKGSSYPQRIWDIGSTAYTNVTTEQELYLINLYDSDDIDFQVRNTANQVISGADVLIQRDISGVNTIIASGLTGAAGSYATYLSPDFQYNVTISKEGFTTFSDVFAPTESEYIIILGGTTAQEVYDFTRGIDISIEPYGNTTLFNDTNYNFNLTLSSSYWTVDSFGFSLRLINGSILQLNSSNTNGGFLDLNQSTQNYSTIYFDYYWLIDGNYTNRTTKWIIINSAYTDWSISTFFSDLNNYLDSGLFGIDNFGRYLIIFLIIFISIGVMTYKYGFTNPMVITALVFGIVFFFDVAVELIPSPINAIPHFPTFLIGLILIVMIFRGVVR